MYPQTLRTLLREDEHLRFLEQHEQMATYSSPSVELLLRFLQSLVPSFPVNNMADEGESSLPKDHHVRETFKSICIGQSLFLVALKANSVDGYLKSFSRVVAEGLTVSDKYVFHFQAHRLDNFLAVSGPHSGVKVQSIACFNWQFARGSYGVGLPATSDMRYELNFKVKSWHG